MSPKKCESLLGIVLCGCHSPVNVKPVTFDHPDEIIRDDTFVALADRRVFAVMAFINACGFDDEASGIAMHPVRRRVREAIHKKASEHGDLFDKWKRYYNRRSFPSYCYMDYALSLSSDYPFRRIRPGSEFTCWWRSQMLNSFPKILNGFWETVELEEIWSQVKLDYLTQIKNYDFGKMASELAFVWEYLRLDRKDRFIFISVPNLLGSHYTDMGAHYENYYYAVEGPREYSNGFNIHEYLHSFINALMNKHYASQRKKLNAYFVAGKDYALQSRSSATLPRSGLVQSDATNIHEIRGQFRSKTLTVKNKNKIFPKFLSPSIKTTYGPRASENGRNFDSKLHTRLIIEAVFFCPHIRSFEFESLGF